MKIKSSVNGGRTKCCITTLCLSLKLNQFSICIKFLINLRFRSGNVLYLSRTFFLILELSRTDKFATCLALSNYLVQYRISGVLDCIQSKNDVTLVFTPGLSVAQPCP